MARENSTTPFWHWVTFAIDQSGKCHNSLADLVDASRKLACRADVILASECFDFSGRGSGERNKSVYQGGGRQSKIRRGVGEWRSFNELQIARAWAILGLKKVSPSFLLQSSVNLSLRYYVEQDLWQSVSKRLTQHDVGWFVTCRHQRGPHV